MRPSEAWLAPGLNKSNMAKVRRDMEARLVRRAPGTQSLIGIHAGRGDGPEEVHAPLRALYMAIQIEERQRNLHR